MKVDISLKVKGKRRKWISLILIDYILFTLIFIVFLEYLLKKRDLVVNDENILATNDVL